MIWAVNRALSILKCFNAGDQALSLSEISRRTGLDKATGLRMLATLEHHSMIMKTEGGAYRLGPELLHLGTLFGGSFDFTDIIKPALRRLTEITGESASFFVKEGIFRRCILRVESPHTVRDHVHVGDLLPLPLGAFGRVITAFGNPECPPAGNVGLPIVTKGERVAEMASIAMPVWGPKQGFRGALGVSLPIFRLDAKMVKLASAHVLIEADGLTRRLGGTSEVTFPIRENRKRSNDLRASEKV